MPKMAVRMKPAGSLFLLIRCDSNVPFRHEFHLNCRVCLSFRFWVAGQLRTHRAFAPTFSNFAYQGYAPGILYAGSVVTGTTVIEDSVAGVTGALAAGMMVFGYHGGSHCRPDTADSAFEPGSWNRTAVDQPLGRGSCPRGTRVAAELSRRVPGRLPLRARTRRPGALPCRARIALQGAALHRASLALRARCC